MFDWLHFLFKHWVDLGLCMHWGWEWHPPCHVAKGIQDWFNVSLQLRDFSSLSVISIIMAPVTIPTLPDKYFRNKVSDTCFICGQRCNCRWLQTLKPSFTFFKKKLLLNFYCDHKLLKLLTCYTRESTEEIHFGLFRVLRDFDIMTGTNRLTRSRQTV